MQLSEACLNAQRETSINCFATVVEFVLKELLSVLKNFDINRLAERVAKAGTDEPLKKALCRSIIVLTIPQINNFPNLSVHITNWQVMLRGEQYQAGTTTKTNIVCPSRRGILRVGSAAGSANEKVPKSSTSKVVGIYTRPRLAEIYRSSVSLTVISGVGTVSSCICWSSGQQRSGPLHADYPLNVHTARNARRR